MTPERVVLHDRIDFNKAVIVSHVYSASQWMPSWCSSMDKRPLSLTRRDVASGPAQRRAPAIAISLVVALCLAVPAIVPLLRPGFFVSDDGLFHLYRLAELDRCLRQGLLYPRWFQSFGFGYGQPVLNFYSPLSYYLGEPFLLLGIGPLGGTKLLLAVGFLLSALTVYLFAQELWGRAGGLLATAAYTVFPYHLADVYQRGAFPEALAFIFPPLILWSLLRLFQAERSVRRRYALLVAAGWAGLVLTHHLTAFIFAPVAVAYIALLAALTRRWRPVLWAVLALLLAVGLTAFYWLPVLAESRWVGLGLGPSDGYRRHLAPPGGFLSPFWLHRYRPEQGVPADHPLPLLPSLLALMGVATVGRHWHHSWRRAHLLFFAILVALTVFMMAVPSEPIWRLLQPLLGYLQYPWRFMTLTALFTALLIGALPSLWPASAPPWTRPAALVGAISLLMVAGLARLPVQQLSLSDQEVTVERMWAEDAAVGQIGATWTGEYLPIWVREQRWAIGRPRENPADGPIPAQPPSVRLGPQRPLATELELETAEPMSFRLHAFYFPGWQASIDGQPVPVYPSGELGLVTVDVPPGRHHLSLRFGSTLPRRVGTLISVLALAACWGLGWSQGRTRLWLISGGIMLALILGSMFCLDPAGRPTQPRPVAANLEDTALLLGYDLDRPAYRPGDLVEVTLYWLALREIGEDLKVFVHLTDAAGQVLAQHDGDPGGGFTPTTRWRPGELILDRHRLRVPAQASAGSYRLKAGLYHFQPLRNLRVREPPSPDDRVDLGPLPMR